MLRAVLTALGLTFFLSAGLLMVVSGPDSGARLTGGLSALFFGGLGGLMLRRTLRTRRGGRGQAEPAGAARPGMTRERMVESIARMDGVIHCRSPFYFDIRGPGTPPDVLIDEWVESLKPEWFGSFLDVVAHPPPGVDASWQYSVAQLLMAWTLHDPDRLFPQIGTVVSEEAARPVVLEALADLANPRFLASPQRRGRMAGWLARFVERAQGLSEREQIWLVEAVGGLPPSSGALLRMRLHDRLAGASEDVRQEMAQAFPPEPLE